MLAKDIMTTDVVTVGPETDVASIAQLLVDKRISGVPVVDDEGRPQGMVSEGDLLHQSGVTGDAKRSWWLRFVASTEDQARDYIKRHGRTARDVMTSSLVSVGEDMSLAEVARLLEEHRIKRVPVLRDGRIVGIVSRANLMQALAGHREDGPAAPTPDDRSLRDAIYASLQTHGWVSRGSTNVIVTDGVVELWGWVESDTERRAMMLATEEVSGVKKVIDHLGTIPPAT